MNEESSTRVQRKAQKTGGDQWGEGPWGGGYTCKSVVGILKRLENC